MSKDTILNLMMSHHGLLSALLRVYMDDLAKDPKRAAEALSSFQWELEKHFFTEEKVIFRFCRADEMETCETVKKLEQDHTIMMEMLEDLKNDLEEKAEEDAANFQKLMMEHASIEEKELYPKLDRDLSPAIKEDIIARINEVPLKQ